MNYADDIKSRVTMREVCEMYGIRVNRNNKAICPFHNDSHASMHIYGGQRGYWCYTCNEGGSCIDFVMKFFGLNFPSACEKINADFRLGLPIGRELSLRELCEAERAAKERRRKIEAERAEHQRLLDDYHAALDKYVELDKHRIEYAPDRTGGVLSAFYTEAVKNIAAAENALDGAEMRLYEYEHRRAVNN